MKKMEEAIQETFNAITLPSELREATLSYIERERSSRKASGIHHKADTPETEKAVFEKKVKRGVSKRTAFKAGLSLAACILLCLIGVSGYLVYTQGTALVGIDMNPSLELEVNRFNIVVDTKALNEDGEKVLEATSVIGLPYEKALEEITESKAFLSYVNANSFIDLYIVGEDDIQVSALTEKSEAKLQALPYEGSCTRMSQTIHQEALCSGMGMGRYAAALALIELNSSITLDDCRHMSMRQLRDLITEQDPDNEYAHHRGSQGGRMHRHRNGL